MGVTIFFQYCVASVQWMLIATTGALHITINMNWSICYKCMSENWQTTSVLAYDESAGFATTQNICIQLYYSTSIKEIVSIMSIY